MRTALIALSLLLCPLSSSAAPIPGTASSALVSADKGLFLSPKGFSIHAGKTAWQLSVPPKDIPAVATLYRSPTQQKGTQASLTVRVDELDKRTPLKSYVNSWLKDYSRFGLDVLNSKPVRVSGNKGFLIDVIHRETEKQLRQVVFINKHTAVVLTCRDHRESFTNSVKSCNEIIRSFKWTN